MILGKSYLNSAEIGKIYLGNDVVYESTPSGVDVFPQDNAASLADVNSVGTFIGLGSGVVTVGNTGSYDGSYHIIVTNSDGSNLSGSTIQVPVVSGKTYDISFYAKRGSQGSQQRVVLRNPLGQFNTTILINTTEWALYTSQVVVFSTGNADINCNASHFSSSLIGDSIEVDKFEIIETT